MYVPHRSHSISHVTSTVHIVHELHFMLMAYIIEQIWPTYCKYRLECPILLRHIDFTLVHTHAKTQGNYNTCSTGYCHNKWQKQKYPQITHIFHRYIWGVYMKYMNQIWSPAWILWTKALYTYFANYISSYWHVTLNKYGYNTVNTVHTALILYTHTDAKLVHIHIKPKTTTSSSHVIAFPKSKINILAKLDMIHTPYIWWAYIEDACAYMCHILCY